METPDLPAGSYKYTMSIKDPYSSKTRVLEVRGIQPGRKIEVDLTTFESSAAAT